MNGNNNQIYIQINFTSGIGDFYTYFCEVYFVSKFLKEKNYNVNLIFNSIRKIDFINLFEEKYYTYFDNITITDIPESCESLGNYKLDFPKTEWSTGKHCYEIFVPNDFNDNIEYAYINLSRLGDLTIYKYSDYPKFSNTILEKVKNVKTLYNLDEFSIMHFRDLDDVADEFNKNILNGSTGQFKVREYSFNNNIEFTENALKNIEEIVKNENKILVFSNNIKIKNTIKLKYDNIILLNEDYEKTIVRDYDDKIYWEYCLVEFILSAYSKKIYLFSNYCWISNFIAYGILNNIHYNPVDPYDLNNDLVKVFNTYHKNLL